MWRIREEKDAIYANPDATEDDYVHAAELESRFAEYDGYTAEARAGELLLGIGIGTELHERPMSEVAPGWKLRVLLAQALFADPDILLLDEPTNNLDINSIRWLEDVLNERSSTMVIISHDRHFLNSVCTHMADLDYGTLRVYPGNYDDYMIASTQARAQVLSANAKAKERIADLQEFVRRFSANKSKARQATSRARQIEKIRVEDVKPSSRQNPYLRFDVDAKQKLHRNAVEIEGLAKGWPGQPRELFAGLSLNLEAGARLAIIGPNGAGKTTLLRTLLGELAPGRGTRALGGEGGHRLLHAGPDRAPSTATSPWSSGCGSGRRRATTSRSCGRPLAGCSSPATTARSRCACCRAARRDGCSTAS